MRQVTFVILHYMSIEMTIKCINSIFQEINYYHFRIVIIDNGSPDYSGLQLKKMYSNNEAVDVICLTRNVGFSAGNNVGFRIAKEKYKADFIAIINNDTEIIQSNFVEKMMQIYDETNYYVLGPDIINLEGIHQSPQRNHVITGKEARNWYLKRFLFSIYLHFHKKMHLSNNFIVYKKYKKHDRRRKLNLSSDKVVENVELQGACFIFSPLYISLNHQAFEEKTFMYGEEALLALRCTKNGWKILYDPNIKIKHAEKYATRKINGDEIEGDIFWSDHHVKAIREIRKYIRDNGK